MNPRTRAPHSGRATASLLLAVLLVSACSPTRSTAAFCETLSSKKADISAELREGLDRAETSEDALTALFNGLGTTAGALGDLANYFEELSRVAPSEIETDMQQIAEGYQKQLDNAAEVLDNPLSAFADSIIGGFQMQGPLRRVNEFALTNCGESI